MSPKGNPKGLAVPAAAGRPKSAPNIGNASGKKKGKKNKKNKVDEIVEENEALKNKLQDIENNVESLNGKLRAICQKVVDIANKDDYITPSNEETILDISTDDYLLMLNKLAAKKERKIRNHLESRVEELETRVTQQNVELAALLKAKLAYECGLQEICVLGNIYAVRQVARALLHDLQSATSFVEPPALLTKRRLTWIPDLPNIDYPYSPVPHDGIIDKICASEPELPETSLYAITPYKPLRAPPRRMPGDTHISHMNKGLRQYIAAHLNVIKLSGIDWRKLAERLGMKPEAIQYWSSLQLASPTERVLAEWERSSGATVRLLHRHLTSPDMRCTVLGKVIADFYKVD